MNENNLTAVVTGAGSGIGKAVALLFAERNYTVFAADLQYDDQSRAELEGAGVDCSPVDVRNVSQLQQMVTRAVEKTGRLDAMINNAGIGMVRQIEDATEQDWDNVIDTNLKAVFFGCRFAVQQMMTQESGGSIVNVASNAGLLPRAHDPVYSISKQAVIGLTRSVALCHSKDRIRVNAVCPGPVERTTMINENFEGRDDHDNVVRELIHASPLARAWDRMVTPEEIAESVFYLCSNAAQMITGTSVAVDGGKSLGVPPAV